MADLRDYKNAPPRLLAYKHEEAPMFLIQRKRMAHSERQSGNTG
jgi:hypothetical protein